MNQEGMSVSELILHLQNSKSMVRFELMAEVHDSGRFSRQMLLVLLLGKLLDRSASREFLHLILEQVSSSEHLVTTLLVRLRMSQQGISPQSMYKQLSVSSTQRNRS